MAFIVTRTDRRSEIRESVSTAAGPRSRTLATFSELTEDVIERAALRAQRPFDADAVRAAARRAGVPIAVPPAETAARALAAELERGATLSPALAGVLAAQLASLERAPVSDAARAAAGWADASAADRGAALHDLLLLGDALPMPASRLRPEAGEGESAGRHGFPRLESGPVAP